MYKTGHAFSCLLLKESVANDIINVSLLYSLFAGPVCCEPCQMHRRVEASSVGLCRRWRRSFWTVLMIATLKIIMQNCRLARAQWAFQVLEGSVETLFGWSDKRLYRFVANLFRIQCTKFHQNRPSYIRDITKQCWSFFWTQCILSTK